MLKKAFLILAIITSATCFAQSEKRLALIVGNSDYGSGNSLKNPVNDAKDVSAKLNNMGFDVITLLNCSLLEMDDAVDEFGKKAKNYDIALFFYSGHGLQLNNENFLIPANAQLNSEADVKYRCINVNQVLDKLDESGCPMKIIVLDACRDNPYEHSWHRSTGSGGLSIINASKGTLISYATSPGKTAGDGKGRNSPYTAAFLKTLDTPGLTLLNFFNEISIFVQEATNEEQTPWTINSAIKRDFCFNYGRTPSKNSKKENQQNVGIQEQKEQIDKLLRDAQNKYDIAMDYIKKEDYSNAISFLIESADMGNDNAQNYLGDMYYRGIGIEQNDYLAATYYLKAANAGNYNAQFNIGWMYEHGYGVEPNIETALNWYHQSSLQGFKPAYDNWIRLFEEYMSLDSNSITSTQQDDLEFKINGVPFTMKYVEGGTFLMGAQNQNPDRDNYSEDARDEEGPVHTVLLSNYYIGETEVTIALWNAVMGTHFEHKDQPICNISFDEVLAFIDKLNQISNQKFRLPTEAEWEYAAKGGKHSHNYAFSGSDEIDDVTLHYYYFIIGVYPDYSSEKIEDVKQAISNELGVYDMTGNVQEWCSDWYGDYIENTQINPVGPESGNYRVVRGGYYMSTPEECRVTARRHCIPNEKFFNTGFRLVLSE
ncbi:MAG: SUMF1/EgtB/PvdO family nonheme iron enzyme [Bacteroidales bacterium]|nr:SUMF1/EgtB/PvdO family nonheme iron enzyme [Bacteroidales bacterium]